VPRELLEGDFAARLLRLQAERRTEGADQVEALVHQAREQESRFDRFGSRNG
jgi:UDP-N-acetyl-D-mannosaminuronic acid transferase (WecB/TagA/CpsF family)